jgi:hypothetical protein
MITKKHIHFREQHACLSCRISFKNFGGSCPECKKPLIAMGKSFRAPARTAKKQWEKVILLRNAGERFHHHAGNLGNTKWEAKEAIKRSATWKLKPPKDSPPQHTNKQWTAFSGKKPSNQTMKTTLDLSISYQTTVNVFDKNTGGEHCLITECTLLGEEAGSVDANGIPTITGVTTAYTNEISELPLGTATCCTLKIKAAKEDNMLGQTFRQHPETETFRKFFKENGEVTQKIKTLFPSADDSGDILIIASIELENFAKKTGAGAVFMERILRDLGRHCSLILLTAFPLDQIGKAPSSTQKTGVAKLKAYYEKFGFKSIEKDMMGICPKDSFKSKSELNTLTKINVSLPKREKKSKRKANKGFAFIKLGSTPKPERKVDTGFANLISFGTLLTPNTK